MGLARWLHDCYGVTWVGMYTVIAIACIYVLYHPAWVIYTGGLSYAEIRYVDQIRYGLLFTAFALLVMGYNNSRKDGEL